MNIDPRRLLERRIELQLASIQGKILWPEIDDDCAARRLRGSGRDRDSKEASRRSIALERGDLDLLRARPDRRDGANCPSRNLRLQSFHWSRIIWTCDLARYACNKRTGPPQMRQAGLLTMI